MRRAWFAVLAVVVSACGSAASTPNTELVVSAAASLSDAFSEIGAAFERDHPGVEVVLNLGGSSSLREQILGGAGADVFASADRENMDRIVAAGETRSEPTVMASNRLAIAVPSGNPGSVRGVGDFDRDDLFLGLCAATVPCGVHAATLFDRAGVHPDVDTREPDVRALLTKIEEGELDAGIVYATDVLSSGAVDSVPIPTEIQVSVEYVIATLARTDAPAAASDFVDFVMGTEARAILERWGFTG